MPKFNSKKDKVQDIINKSGNDLQFKVIDYLNSHEWETSVSPYYNDPATGKPREIDIIASRKWPIKDAFGDYQLGELVIRLFIECKHIKDPVVFWFMEKNMLSAMKLAKDNNILLDKQDYYISQNQASAKHHYADNIQVAKISDKSGNRDDFFKAINQCLNGLIFFADKSSDYYTIDFPIIITDSFQNIHKRDVENGHVVISEPFQQEVDYSYKQLKNDGTPIDVSKYFLIDIVGFDKLDSFLQDLENRDIKLLREQLHWDLDFQERQKKQLNQKPYNSLDPYE